MKPKTAASIFDEMINEGKIDDVFDIILKLKEKNVTALMKFLSVQSAMQITEKLENFNVNDVKE
jgi:predicted transcriptional regulator